MNAYPVRKGEEVELAVERLAFGGRGVARVDGYTVFVPLGIPGQRVRGRIVKRKKQYAEAVLLEVLAPSPDQVEPRCAHFGTCGGCAWQHLAYERQTEAKRQHVVECLERIGGLSAEVEPALSSPDAFGYRNKMEFTFSTRWLTPAEMEEAGEADRFGAGLHVRGRFDRVVDVERCHLYPPEGSEILARVRRIARESGLPPYSTRTHRGFWRFLVVREGANTGERMVHLITNLASPGSREWSAVERAAAAVRAEGPAVTSFLHGITDRKSSVAVCEEVRTVYGEPAIRERLLGLTYEIGPNTFFQTNTRAAERLFTEALARGGFGPEETVWDLYCGAGALSLPLARRVRRVIGVEVVEEAVAAAGRNAAANGITNAEFHAGDVREVVGALPAPVDAVVLDPPRDGVHADVLAAVAERRPERIVYVSCNPATLARDLAILAERGYAAKSVLPVDLFPHTPHVEAVAALARG